MLMLKLQNAEFLSYSYRVRVAMSFILSVPNTRLHNRMSWRYLLNKVCFFNLFVGFQPLL